MRTFESLLDDSRLSSASTGALVLLLALPPLTVSTASSQIVTGDEHTCAILITGAVTCWSFGGNGRLGYGNTTTIGDDETPASAGTADIGGGALPVELTSLTASLNGASAALDWSTASETNNSGFGVQHDAGNGWASLAFVAGAGTTLEAQHYTFRTADLAPGTHRFRLEQRDLDRATELSPVVELNVGAFEATLVVTRSEIRLTLAHSEQARVSIYDALGREVVRLHDGTVDGPVTWATPGALASGVYFVRVSGERTRMTQSLVITR